MRALAFALALLGAATAHAQTFPDAPRTDALPNGLRVVSIRTDAPGIIAYYSVVRVGSRDEVEEGHSGYAHLFEHMMFRGTETYPQDRYEATIQSFGADNNAYTTQDSTVYTVVGPSSALAQIVELEADRFQHLSFSEDDYRTETGAVRGEYDTAASNPFLRMWEGLSELAFSEHTYGHTTLGYLRDIERMPEEVGYARDFLRRFYTPDNVTIVVAGDVDHDALMTEVRARYGRWRGRRAEPTIPTEPPPTDGAHRHIDWPAQAAPRMFVGWRTPGFVSGRREAQRRAALRTSAALRVVHGLAFSEPSPLYQRLVVQEQRAIELGSWADEMNRDPHLFIAHATLRPDEDFDAVIAQMQQAVDALGAGEVDPERLAAVKSHVRYAMLSGLQTPSDYAQLAAEFISAGGSLDLLDPWLEELAAVTAEDVARVAREHLTEDRRYVITLAHGAAE